MYDRFTDRLRRVMQRANEDALRLGHEQISSEHLLLALLKDPSGVAAKVLINLQVDLRKLGIEVEKLGFKAVIQSGLILHVQDALEVNFEMMLGSSSESVTVVAGWSVWSSGVVSMTGAAYTTMARRCVVVRLTGADG